MAHTAEDWRRYAAALAEYLAERGLRDPGWIEAFRRVPRHEFADGGDWDRVRVRDAYADEVIPTRFASDHGACVATSSVSQPIVVALMLEMLDVTDGSRVLEIGTGPGYNAALMCARLGDDKVTSVDIQADLVDQARRRLDALGYHPFLTAGDGYRGCPPRAPFDRIIATCGMPRVPEAWLPQLAEGARVVVPLRYGGAVAILDRYADGTLNGNFSRQRFFFMKLRDGVPTSPQPAPGMVESAPRLEFGPSELADPDFALWLELCLPGLDAYRLPPMYDEPAGLRVSGGSADVEVTFGPEGEVSGDAAGRRLWELMTRVYGLWTHHGCPTVDQLGLSVSPRRQWVWCDDPASEVSWELPAGG